MPHRDVGAPYCSLAGRRCVLRRDSRRSSLIARPGTRAGRFIISRRRCAMPDADARFRDDEPRRTSCAAPRPSGARQVLAMPLEGVKNFLVTLVSVKRVDRPGSTVWDAAATVVASRQLPSGRMGPLGAIGGGTIAPPPAHARRTPHGSVALCWGTPCGRALAQHSSDTSVTFAQESDRVFALATRFLPPAAREFAHPSTTQENPARPRWRS